MSIATGKGDGGETKLIGGVSVSKADLRVEAYGTVDELGAQLGLARSHSGNDPLNRRLEQLQRELFIIGAELATPPDSRAVLSQRVDEAMVQRIDDEVTEIEGKEGILRDWALPGATRVGAYLDVARTVCRRAERRVVALLTDGREDNPLLMVYLNRLGDLLWLYARWFEVRMGAEGALRPDSERKRFT